MDDFQFCCMIVCVLYSIIATQCKICLLEVGVAMTINLAIYKCNKKSNGNGPLNNLYDIWYFQAEIISSALTTVVSEGQEGKRQLSNGDLTNRLRDAFLETSGNPQASDQVSSILLQLIELQATDWQLPREALIYFYFNHS